VRVYYFIGRNRELIGSINEEKIRIMADGRGAVFFCDISEFDGYLMGSDWHGA